MINFKDPAPAIKEIAHQARFTFKPEDYATDFSNPANDALAMEIKGILKRQLSWSIGMVGMDSERLVDCIWKHDPEGHIRKLIDISVKFVLLKFIILLQKEKQ